jgi:hypothetical protein
MKIFTIIAAVGALLLLLSMLLCGLWSKAKGIPDEAGKKFHSQLGIVTIICSIVAIILLLILL